LEQAPTLLISQQLNEPGRRYGRYVNNHSPQITSSCVGMSIQFDANISVGGRCPMTPGRVLDEAKDRGALPPGEPGGGVEAPAGAAGGAPRAGAGARAREWHHSLDARPLETAYREWLEAVAPDGEESLGRLKERVEES